MCGNAFDKPHRGTLGISFAINPLTAMISGVLGAREW